MEHYREESRPTNQPIHSREYGHNHDGNEKEEPGWKSHWDLLLALFVLVVLLILEYGFYLEHPKIPSFTIPAIAYLLAGRSVLGLAFRKSRRAHIFNEFVLMRWLQSVLLLLVNIRKGWL